jgi:hypothetical protein
MHKNYQISVNSTGSQKPGSLQESEKNIARPGDGIINQGVVRSVNGEYTIVASDSNTGIVVIRIVVSYLARAIDSASWFLVSLDPESASWFWVSLDPEVGIVVSCIVRLFRVSCLVSRVSLSCLVSRASCLVFVIRFSQSQ